MDNFLSSILILMSLVFSGHAFALSKDLKHAVLPVKAISHSSQSDNTAAVSAIIDTKGYNSMMFALMSGALADADATFTTLVEHCDAANCSDAAAVSDADLIGTEALASYTFAEDNTVKSIGYKGIKRYLRLTITPANNTGASEFSVLALMGHGAIQPIN